MILCSAGRAGVRRTKTQKHAQRGCAQMCAMCAVVCLFRGKNTRCARRKRESREDREFREIREDRERPLRARGKERKKRKKPPRVRGNFLSEWYRCGADTKKPPMGSTYVRPIGGVD